MDFQSCFFNVKVDFLIVMGDTNICIVFTAFSYNVESYEIIIRKKIVSQIQVCVVIS